MSRPVRVDLVFLGISLIGLITNGAVRPGAAADIFFVISAAGAAIWMVLLALDLRKQGSSVGHSTSAHRTPTNPPAPTRLVPLQREPEEAKAAWDALEEMEGVRPESGSGGEPNVPPTVWRDDEGNQVEIVRRIWQGGAEALLVIQDGRSSIGRAVAGLEAQQAREMAATLVFCAESIDAANGLAPQAAPGPPMDPYSHLLRHRLHDEIIWLRSHEHHERADLLETWVLETGADAVEWDAETEEGPMGHDPDCGCVPCNPERKEGQAQGGDWQ